MAAASMANPGDSRAAALQGTRAQREQNVPLQATDPCQKAPMMAHTSMVLNLPTARATALRMSEQWRFAARAA